MAVMLLFVFPIYQDVIHVAKNIWYTLQYPAHHPLENLWGFGYLEGKFVPPKGSYKGGKESRGFFEWN